MGLLKVLKFLMIAVNGLFMLGGLGLAGAGIWIIIDGNSFKETFSDFLNFDSVVTDYIAYGAIGVGGFVAFISFLGCCGAWKESKCLLSAFITFMIIFIAIEIVVAALALYFPSNLKTLLEGPATSVIDTAYGVESSITQTYDDIHQKYKCCGFNGGSDFKDSLFDLSVTTVNPWPASCCPNMVTTGCLDVDPPTSSYSNDGCLEVIEAELKTYGDLVGGIVIGLAAVQLLAVIFSCCICCCSSKKGSVKPYA